MTTLKYSVSNGKAISSHLNNGNIEGLAYSAAYVSKPSADVYGRLNSKWWSSDTPPRYFGSDNGDIAYTYSASMKVPVGKSFSIILNLTGYNNFTDQTTTKKMLIGYTLTKPAAKSEPTWGTKNSPAGLKTSEFTMPGAKRGETSTAEIKLTLPDSYSGKTVYLFFWGKNATTTWSLWRFNKLEASIEYLPYTKVSTPNIFSINSERLAPAGNFSITIQPSEDGMHNPVTGYRIFFSTSEVTITSSYTDKPKPGEDNKITLSYQELGSPARGEKVYLGIQALGTAVGYDSDLYYNQHFILVNFKPDAPNIIYSNSTVPKNGNSWPIKISSINSEDQDYLNPLIFYYLNSDSENDDGTQEWMEVPSNLTIACNRNKLYLLYKAWDGFEFSDIKSTTLKINPGPTNFYIKAVSGQAFNGYTGENYTRKINSEVVGDSSYQYIWNYKYDSSEETLYLGEGQNLKNIPINQGKGTLSFYVVATDKYGDSNTSQIFSTKLRYAAEAKDKVNFVLYNIKNCESVSEITQFSREMSVKSIFSNMEIDNVYIHKILITAKNLITEELISQNSFVNYDAFNSLYGATEHKINLVIDQLLSKDLGKCKLNISLYTISNSKEELEIYSQDYQIELIPLFTEVFPTVAAIDLNLKNNDLQSVTVNAGLDINQVRGMQVIIQSPLTREYYDITEYTTFILESGYVNSILTFDNPQKIFQTCHLISNQDYEVNIYVFPINILGESYVNLNNISSFISSQNTIQASFKVLFNSLYIAGEGNSKPYILPYIVYRHNKEEGNHPDWMANEIFEKERMFNPGEFIYFDNNYLIQEQLDLYYDGSGNDPVKRVPNYKYSIQYSILDDEGNTKEWNSIGAWTNLEQIDILRIPDSFSLNREKLCFKLKVIDEYGLLVLDSENNDSLITSSEHYLIACRKAQPSITISDCTIGKNEFDIILKIDDYGGNNLGYENFNRQISNSNLQEGVEGSYKITWRCGEDINNLASIEEYKIGMISNLSLESDGILPDLSRTLNLGDLNKLSGRIYLEVTITFYYNAAGDYISTKTPIFIIYTEGPTVSYRYHQLGINTDIDAINDKSEKIYDQDILTVSDFQNKRYVRLKGDYTEDNFVINREIVIDLKTGLVSGLVIQSGTW